jgi:hypothetical protein
LSPLAEALERVTKSKLDKLEPGTRRGVYIDAEDALIKFRGRKS